MKDLKLPIYTQEERDQMWNSLNEGDKIVRIEWKHWNDGYDITSYNIIKKTPKGSLRLDNNKLIKNFEGVYYVLNDDIKCFICSCKLEKDVMRLLSKVQSNKREFKNNLTVDSALELKELLSNIMKDIQE